MGDTFGISGIASAAGQVAAAALQADAIKEATQTQIDALERQKKFVFDQLQPEKLNAQASAADVQRAKDRLALQGITDPALLQARYAAQQKLLQQVNAVGNQGSDAVAAQAAAEATASTAGIDKVKSGLIDAALSELEAGASLPPDVQAELVKAGLEQSSLVSGNANPRGVAGTTTRKLIGERALALKAERQGRAAALATTAQNLSTARANILASIFPALKQQESANQGLTQSAFQQSNGAVPEAGLGGTDIANIWLSRVGATNQLAQSAADAAARGAIGTATAYGNIAGAGTRLATSLIPTGNTGGSSFANPYSNPGDVPYNYSGDPSSKSLWSNLFS